MQFETIVTNIFALIIIITTKTIKCETLYHFYTNGGITSGLRADGNDFHLNDRPIILFSGSFHYFRVHPSKWRPILKKFKAVGLNAVDFYSPWNLHEEMPGHFDFETGFLNVTDFLTAIKEADLLAIFRPGPFICAEWDFGGLPAWLLRDPNMKVRSTYKPYLDAVDNYWRQLFSVVRQFQFQNGGPIIAVQMENEFGSYGNTKTNPKDAQYMRLLSEIAHKYGINELLFTSDGPRRQGSIDIYFKAINFHKNTMKYLQDHKADYPMQPLFVAEFWSGWFDNWSGRHSTLNETYYEQQMRTMMRMNASINAYMFIGGTNYGFTAGNVGRPNPGAITGSVTTSYDYDAPLTESGNYTAKYWLTKRLMEEFNIERNLTQFDRPEPPAYDKAVGYGIVEMGQQLSLNDVLKYSAEHKSNHPISMENINVGPNYGQNFGFVLYRTRIGRISTIKFTKGRVNDRAALLVDGKQFATIYAKNVSFSQTIPSNLFASKKNGQYTLDILVENLGRVDYGPTIADMNLQRKGLNEEIVVDNKTQTNWSIFALDFKQPFVDRLKNQSWHSITDYKEPTFYRTSLVIEAKPEDTYLKMTNWTTGVVFINGFNIGRYWNVGPTQTLYVSANLLNTGVNELIVFETHKKGNHIEFIDRPILG